ncbi:WD repeat-containing protein 89 [Entomortierella beljakovae]|nr:WD repeat-containing protein 89 [Entomortierella beljakovae]
MNDGIPSTIPITYEPRLIQPPLGLKQSSAFSHGDIYIFDIVANTSNLIVSASNHEIKLYNPSTLAIKNVLKYHTKPITQMKAHGENILMSSSKDGSIAVWDLRTDGQPVQIFSTQSKDPLLCFDINSTEHILAAGTELIEYDANIHFFDARSNTSAIIKTYSESHSDDITNIKFHPSNPMRVMTGAVDGLICQFDLTDMDEDEGIVVVTNTRASINKIGYFGPSSEYIYSLSHMETLSLWNSDEADPIHQFGDIRGASNPQLGLKLDYGIDCKYEPETGRLYLISGSNEGNINILHVMADTLQLCQVLNGGHSEIVRSTHWDPKRGILFSGGEDSRLGLWTSDSQSSPVAASTPSRHSSPLHSKSPDGEVHPPSDLNVVIEDKSPATLSTTSSADAASKKPPSSPHTLAEVPVQEVKDNDDDDDGEDLEIHPPVSNTATSVTSPVTNNTQSPNVAASENEQKLTTLTEAFPSVEREVCEFILESHQGNVEASFIALLEISDPEFTPDVQTQAPASNVVPPALPRRRESDLTQGVANINLGENREIDPILLASTSTTEQQLRADEDFARTLAAMDEYRARDRQNVRDQKQQQQQQEEETSFAAEFKEMMDDELPKIKERFNVAADTTKKKVTEWYNQIKAKAEAAQAQRNANQQAAGSSRERREPVIFDSRLEEEEPLSRHRVTPPLQSATPPLPGRPYNTTDVSTTETSTNDRRTTIEDGA